MKFDSFEDVAKFCTHIEREKNMLVRLAQVHELLIVSLIASHPNYDQFQLLTTSLLEKSMNGEFKDIPEDDKQIIRNRIEHLQAVPKTVVGNPLTGFTNKGN